jgi:predicted aspartyl protease
MPEVKFTHDRRQLLIPVAILPPGDFQFERVFGLLDTGASISGVSRRIAETLNLPRQGKMVIATPKGDHATAIRTFMIGLFPGEISGNTLPFVLPDEFVGIECSTGGSFEVLIGMDVLGRGKLVVEPDGTGSFSF